VNKRVVCLLLLGADDFFMMHASFPHDWHGCRKVPGHPWPRIKSIYQYLIPSGHVMTVSLGLLCSREMAKGIRSKSEHLANNTVVVA